MVASRIKGLARWNELILRSCTLNYLAKASLSLYSDPEADSFLDCDIIQYI